MKVEELIIYPIKSLQGIKVPSAQVEEKGLQYDRRWMLVDEQGVFITQRKNPELSQLQISMGNEKIEVRSDNSSVEVPLIGELDKSLGVQIWDAQLNAYKAKTEINEWFSTVLERKCSLVYMPEKSSERLIDKSTVSFADEYPYLLLGEESMNDLNTRMESPLPIYRFRPNIIFSGGKPYEEDNWRKFSIGNISFEGIAPCIRCVFTTIDQQTGKMGKEPLKTLSTYRNVGKGVVFGLHATVLSTGTIRAGDQISVQSKKS